MLARGVLCRLAADVPKTSTHDLSQLARAIQRNLSIHNGLVFPAVRALSYAYKAALADRRRCYATAATKPTATVKKAVKKTAAAKKTTPRKTAAKKAAPKKTAAKKTKAKTTKKATKAKPKKKKAVAKPKAKPKRRVKKVPTPEEKAKLQLKALKAKALRDPGRGTVSAFAIFLGEFAKANHGKEGGITKAAVDGAAKFKTLTPAEREHYNHVAAEATTARRAEYDAWVKSHTPDEIRIANLARASLRRKSKTASGRPFKHTQKIHDDRQVAGAAGPYATFTGERFASGDMKGIAAGDAVKLIAVEWKALGASEKKKYTDSYSARAEERTAEFERVYGHKSK
ncbi:hypothetical protein P154DRAFT_100480 [Amniculicola lignicola CBS 123094]|uniref:HMG box domain-containing protein n=1 Tax=Amniculicola lignicola CBS 123094 TaxID=1392246 RepID=A0A6A5WR23_9PLEO|nr:hypothetical protein P154DRAFT_100480 [Amniculicola lignicola CBS 123094]